MKISSKLGIIMGIISIFGLVAVNLLFYVNVKIIFEQNLGKESVASAYSIIDSIDRKFTIE